MMMSVVSINARLENSDWSKRGNLVGPLEDGSGTVPNFLEEVSTKAYKALLLAASIEKESNKLKKSHSSNEISYLVISRS